MEKRFLLLTCLLCCCALCQSAFGRDGNNKSKRMVFIQDITLNAGATATLEVKLDVERETVGFQFDLYLPQGVTLTDEPSTAITSGSIINDKSHFLDAEMLKNGVYRVLCYSLQNCAFNSNSGIVANINVNVDKDLPNGIYPIVLKNIEIANSNGLNSIKLKETESALSVTDEDISGITQIESDNSKADNSVYNLMGQKVKKLHPGQIGILNGKKIMVNK